MIWYLLSGAADDSAAKGCDATSLIPFALILAAAVVLFFFSRRSQKKQQEKIDATLDAIQPGNKVKTIGGICGVVVELCPEDNTFILETGSETSGKSYIKFDKKAVYQTDAVPAPVVEETPAEEAPVEETTDAPFEETEAPVEEVSAEEAPATEKDEKAE